MDVKSHEMHFSAYIHANVEFCESNPDQNLQGLLGSDFLQFQKPDLDSVCSLIFDCSG